MLWKEPSGRWLLRRNSVDHLADALEGAVRTLALEEEFCGPDQNLAVNERKGTRLGERLQDEGREPCRARIVALPESREAPVRLAVGELSLKADSNVRLEALLQLRWQGVH